MGCTKQTPRNPVLERPLAAMGIDVQERRVPSKPTTKKIPNGGKQPCKHILHKTLKKNQQQVVLKSPIGIIQVYWSYTKYVGINNLLKV